MNLVQERDFYRIKFLNEDEKKVYNLFVNRMPADVQKALSSHMDTYLKLIEWQKFIKTLKSALELRYGGYDRIPSEIKDEFLKVENIIDIAINNTEEDYHSGIEGQAIRINLLQERNTSFYYDDNKKATNKGYYDDEQFEFILFICIQYFRTKAIKERWISNFEPCLNLPYWNSLNIPRENIHLENLAHHFLGDIQNRIANSLRKKSAHLALLINETNISFITSDQPVINLCANYKQLSEETKKLVFYYPISPNIAITLNDENLQDKIKLNIEKVDEYNNAIINASYEYIIADRLEIIKRYIDT
nr:DUF4238 domain-containing protein [Clostridium sp. 001]